MIKNHTISIELPDEVRGHLRVPPRPLPRELLIIDNNYDDKTNN